jgi:hypothetical protein
MAGAVWQLMVLVDLKDVTLLSTHSLIKILEKILEEEKLV